MGLNGVFMIKKLFRTKSIERIMDEAGRKDGLKRTLGPISLMFIGIGATLGTGVFVLTGIEAATYAGPSIIISFALAGFTAACAALTYAELASMVPISGSAYTYSYATIGEFLAWMVGWNLILEYAVSLSAVAGGWSAYVHGLLTNIFGKELLPTFFNGPPAFMGGKAGCGFDLLAVLIVLFITLLLSRGVKQGAYMNNIMVLVNLSAILVFVFFAIPNFNIDNWHPFFIEKLGWRGTVTAASIVFFAYLGFDAVSTTSEESKNPQRDLPIGIIGSLLVCGFLYILISGLLTGDVPYAQLNTAQPVAYALSVLGYKFGSALVAVGALFGLTSVILTVMYGQTRIFYAMSRDGLIPEGLCRVNEKTNVPSLVIWLTGGLIALIAAFLPVAEIAEMANIGTYFAFTTTSLAVLILRKRRPDAKRSFKCPMVWIIAPTSILLCCFFSTELGSVTWERFIIWSILGCIIYFVYGRYNSAMEKCENEKK
jgi:basic amino acid/polyamine antiporter, APA family